MRFSTIWVLLYFVITAILLGINWEYAGAQFSTRLIFTRAEIQLILLFAVGSFVWMLILMAIDIWQLERMKGEVEGLKAKLHDEELREVKKLREELVQKIKDIERSLLDRMDRLEASFPSSPPMV